MTKSSLIDLPNDWLSLLIEEFAKPYMVSLRHFLIQKKKNKKIIYPPGRLIFKAFHLTPFSEIKVVILGQDPYHGPNQAHGLCFSVPEFVPFPPSLKNIFLELSSDLKCSIPKSGDLTFWAQQGVFLLNTILTVEAGKPGSHQGKGWEQFTDVVIKKINEYQESVVFVLWGSYAQKKKHLIDCQKHLIIESAHPSPLSAHRGFFGSKPFSKINNYLNLKGKKQIQWILNP